MATRSRSTSSSGMSGNTDTDRTSRLPNPEATPLPSFSVILKTMLCQRPHLILLYPLLLIPFLTRSQQRRQDTLILHFAFDSYRLQPADRARLQEMSKDSKADSISITGYTDKT